MVPISRNLALTELTERTCKWPIGDPLQDDFHFCGNDSGEARPYCSYHARLAFQPSPSARRASIALRPQPMRRGRFPTRLRARASGRDGAPIRFPWRSPRRAPCG